MRAVTMPKWGMEGGAGKVTTWLVAEGVSVESGVEVVEVETEKIAGVVETSSAGVLIRQVASIGDVVAVGGLLAVVGEHEVTPEAVDAFVAGFVVESDAADETGDGSETGVVETYLGPVRFRRMGEGGAAIVLVHGFGGDLDVWLFNQAPLAAERAVYAIELPGHGQSSKLVGDGSVEALAKAVADAIKGLGLDDFHLVGHSLGGALALRFSSQSPGSVASLTLIASAGLGSEINGEYLTGFLGAGRRKEMKPVLGKLFADEGLVSRRMVEDVLRNKRLDGVDTALATIAQSVFAEGKQAPSPRLDDIDVPTLVVWGVHDEIIPVAHAHALASTTRVEVFDNAGHMVHMESAAAVNSLIEEFVSSH